MITNQRPLSALKSEDTIEISSSSFVLSHSKFIISNFFCGRAMRKVTKHEHNSNTGFINSVFLTDFRQFLC